MKKLLFISITVLIISCKHQSIIDQNIEAYVMKNAHNPESYEKIATTPIDTITLLKKLMDEVKSQINLIKNDSSLLVAQMLEVAFDSNALFTNKANYIKHSQIKNISRFDKDLIASSDKEFRDVILFDQKKFEESNNKLNEAKKLFFEDKSKLETMNIKIDSLNKSTNPNAIIGYHFIHQFRGKVPLGGMMLKNAYIETDKDFNIIAFKEE